MSNEAVSINGTEYVVVNRDAVDPAKATPGGSQPHPGGSLMRKPKRLSCTFPPAHPEGCQCLGEPCADCAHALGSHNATGCTVRSGFLRQTAAEMTPCECHAPFDRVAYLATRS